MLRALHYCHHLLDQLIRRFPQGTYIDATLGKGNDTLFIMNHPDFMGHVYGFDIQSSAIEISKSRINNHPKSKCVDLIQDSHANLANYIQNDKINGAVFNLGYLPGGDHQVTTLAPSTLLALHQIRQDLLVGGQILIMVYSGHPAGQIEKEALFQELSTWPQEDFQVLQYGFINQINNPPLLLVVEKLRETT